MQSFYMAKWIAVFFVIALGLALRFLFVWKPRSKRGQILLAILSIILGGLAFAVGSGYIR